MLKKDQFSYNLPPNRIAQEPLKQRDQSKCLIVDRTDSTLQHRTFADIVDFFRPGDVLVANSSRVIPARLYGQKATGGRAELLLLEQRSETRWLALAGGKRLSKGIEIRLKDVQGKHTDITAVITDVLEGAKREVEFSLPTADWLHTIGNTPLPPYIHHAITDPERYQTVYARQEGSAAAPTAGLHFTPDILFALRDRGVLFETVTLHVGLDTFQPMTAENISAHTIHTEWASISPATAQRINEAKLAGGRLIAVGTTSVRTIETAALRSAGITGTLQDISDRDAQGETSSFCPWKPVAAFEGATDLYIYPGYKFRAVDAMITNFHMPETTLMLLVSAFAGTELVKKAYQTALQNDYRFLSFGDAMFITGEHP